MVTAVLYIREDFEVNCELCYRTSRVQTCISEPVLKLEDSRSIRCNSRICYTCVRILEEFLIVINSRVSSFKCNKLPL
jgi:IMP cyclohydrolase